jgi:hypothetical protein
MSAEACANTVGAVFPLLAAIIAVAHSLSSPPRSASCADTVTGTLGRIAERIYAQAESGPNVRDSVRRLEDSAALADAVTRRDRRATLRALRPLLKHQIRRVVIRDARGRVLASIGHAPALAPVRGRLRHAAGTYVLSTATDAEIAGITRAITGATVSLTKIGVRPFRERLRFSFGGERFPGGRLRITLAPRAATADACRATRAQTVAATIGSVGERLYRTEASGASTQRVLRHVAADAPFRQAVVDDQPQALWDAVVRFFRTRWMHVVRIRATMADGRLVNDVGGPYVLAPASRTLYGAGHRRIGRVTLSVQDDTGFIKLMHRFTGAEVVLRTPRGVVPGSAPNPPPPGPHWQRFTFTGRAFPTGPLTITLLAPV